MSSGDLRLLRKRARACTLCAPDLPHKPRPVFQVGREARVLIAGQAPGRHAHSSGIPFDDASGDRLRKWMGITKEAFYDDSKIAILPLSFCFPGRGQHGDLSPRSECAPKWREKFLSAIPFVKLTLVLGAHAVAWHLPHFRNLSLTEVVARWKSLMPDIMVLPHPSPRNNRWLKQNPWFETELLPELACGVKAALI